MFNIRAAIWPADIDSIQRIRTTVFIEEQNVSPELEWDGLDETANHWLAEIDGEPVATCRMLKDGHIGRMAVMKPHRSEGIGERLLQAAIDHAKTQDFFEVYLHAQTHAKSFYERAGFLSYGQEFDDANIPHISMRLQLSTQRLLGQHGGKFAVTHLKDTLLELIPQTSQQLRILSYNLAPSTFDNDELAHWISSLARSSRYTEIRILVVEPSILISRGHRLLTLHQRLSSKILLRRTTGLPHEVKNNLVIADQSGLICQSIKEPDSVWANFNNKPVVENYITQYDELWERGVEIKDVRRLQI